MFRTRDEDYAREINFMLERKTGQRHFFSDSEPEDWGISVSPECMFAIYPAMDKADVKVERYRTANGGYYTDKTYENVEEGFKDLNDATYPLGFEVRRISGQKLIIRDFTGDWFNLELAYEVDDFDKEEIMISPCNYCITKSTDYPKLSPELDVKYGPNGTPMTRLKKQEAEAARAANKWATRNAFTNKQAVAPQKPIVLKEKTRAALDSLLEAIVTAV